MKTHLLLSVALITAGCGGEARRAGESGDTAAPGQADRMPQAMRMPSMDSMPGVRAYLDSVVRAEPEELVTMAGQHRARMEVMLQVMDQDMHAMNMTGDSAWQALADWVRTDLRAIPGLRGDALVLRMRAHAGRMRRLMTMHEGMMMQMEM